RRNEVYPLREPQIVLVCELAQSLHIQIFEELGLVSTEFAPLNSDVPRAGGLVIADAGRYGERGQGALKGRTRLLVQPARAVKMNALFELPLIQRIAERGNPAGWVVDRPEDRKSLNLFGAKMHSDVSVVERRPLCAFS